MELRVLRYFLAVAREESITAAANQLHVTQPTLSRQLMDLEKELGSPLFIRGNRKITLTEEGLFLRTRAQEIIDLADKTDGMISGEVHIGAGETQAIRLIAKAAHRLRDEQPMIHYRLFSGNADDVMEKLDKGLLDFGIVIEPVDISKYDSLKLPYHDLWGVLMRRDAPLAKKNRGNAIRFNRPTPALLPSKPFEIRFKRLVRQRFRTAEHHRPLQSNLQFFHYGGRRSRLCPYH